MRLLDLEGRSPCLSAKIERIHERPAVGEEVEALAAHLREAARSLTTLLPNQPRDASTILDNVREPGALADLVASNLPVGKIGRAHV